ncbi:MAG: hypothetical protein AAB598_01320 [Patescibacteria group bacterium]
MKDWSELKNVIDSPGISSENQQLVRDFLSSFSFQKRQQLMGIFLGFPDKIGLFVNLLKKKIEFAKNPTKDLAEEILDLEHKEIHGLMKEIE